MTRAPSSTAQRIARASASGEIVPSARTTLATSSRDGNATPAMPVPLLSAAAITPATKVPWPTVSLRGAESTKLSAAAMRFSNSGWVPSMPESMTATFTGSSAVGRSGQWSKARMAVRCHCFLASGSLTEKATRRDRRRRST